MATLALLGGLCTNYCTSYRRLAEGVQDKTQMLQSLQQYLQCNPTDYNAVRLQRQYLRNSRCCDKRIHSARWATRKGRWLYTLADNGCTTEAFVAVTVYCILVEQGYHWARLNGSPKERVYVRLQWFSALNGLGVNTTAKVGLAETA